MSVSEAPGDKSQHSIVRKIKWFATQYQVLGNTLSRGEHYEAISIISRDCNPNVPMQYRTLHSNGQNYLSKADQSTASQELSIPFRIYCGLLWFYGSNHILQGWQYDPRWVRQQWRRRVNKGMNSKIMSPTKFKFRFQTKPKEKWQKHSMYCTLY